MVKGTTENTVIVGHGPPLDGSLSGRAGFGAIYVDADAPALYVNVSTTITTDWSAIGGGGSMSKGPFLPLTDLTPEVIRDWLISNDFMEAS